MKNLAQELSTANASKCLSSFIYLSKLCGLHRMNMMNLVQELSIVNASKYLIMVSLLTFQTMWIAK